MAVPKTGRIAATEAEARALASATRLRILRMCLDDPQTNKEIAQRLGANPATILHHVRTLVATGFLAPQPERRGPRNSREVPYLATRKSWRMNTDDAGVAGGRAAMLEAFLQEVRLVDQEAGDYSRLGLRLSPSELEEFRERLSDLLNEFAERPITPEGRPYSLFVALHPDVTRD
jgi:DNA-binding transcriptional ArsR family regulator